MGDRTGVHPRQARVTAETECPKCAEISLCRGKDLRAKMGKQQKGAENAVMMVLKPSFNPGTVIAPKCVEQPILSSPAEWAEISGDPFPWPGCAE